MTKNESKLLSIQGIAKASAFCLLLSAFSVNAAMAAPAPAGTVDEVMAVQQGKKVIIVIGHIARVASREIKDLVSYLIFI